jgi:L-lactate dehydrogenase complex protein LldG
MVVLLESRIVGPYEQAWDLLHSELGAMPRTVNFVTGPSRSGDIEQTLYMGAHGPLQVHILLVRENGPR